MRGRADRRGVDVDPPGGGRLADELVTMSLVLAKAAAGRGEQDARRLADAFCAGARLRIASLWHQLDTIDEVDHASICRAWLARGQ